MIRNLWFLLKTAIVVAVAFVLVRYPGTFTATWFGTEVQSSVAVLVVALAVVVVVATLVSRLTRALVTAPRRLRARKGERRRSEGYRALTKGMVALAAGDADAATHHAREARSLLDNPPLTLLLEAQAAALRGNDAAARQWFEQMLARPETEFLALRGLIAQALKTNNLPEALRFARRAGELQPRARWVLEALPDLEARCGQWSPALIAHERAEHAGLLTGAEARRHMGALLLERSLEAQEEGDAAAATSDAKESLRLRPDFVPGVLRLASAYAARNRIRKAEAVLAHAWKQAPHPALAEAWVQLAADLPPEEQLKRIRRLADMAPASAESHLALATGALAAGDWTAARTHLDRADAAQPTQRAQMLLAELARRAPAGTLAPAPARSAGPLADPAWICDSCAGIAAEWRALCGACGQFDTLHWRRPGTATAALPLQSMLRPLAAPAPAALAEPPAPAVSLAKPEPAPAELDIDRPMPEAAPIDRTEELARTIH